MKSKCHKNIELEIVEISTFFKESVFVFKNLGFPIDNGKLHLSKDKNRNVIDFELETVLPIHPDNLNFKKLGLTITTQINSEERNFYIPEKGVTKISGKSLIPSKSIKGEISKIYSDSFPLEGESFFRLIFKIDDEFGLANFLGSGYSCGDVQYALGLVSLEIEGCRYHVFRHNNNNDIYLIFENLDKTCFNVFKDVCDSIQKSIALLKGNYHQDGHFFFNYDSPSFEKPISLYYTNFGETVVSNFEIINPQEFRTYLEIDSTHNYQLTPLLFPEKTLSVLATKIKQKPQLDRAVELIIYGNEIRSPLIRCSTFSVALETIVSLIHSENKSFFKPLKQSGKISSLLTDLQNVINDSKNELSELEFKFLSKKITYLNTPFNRDKYLLAFDFFKIQLPEYLKELLNTRNLFFHGKTPYEEGLLNSKIPELHLEADRIHMLASILILKYAGYEGHVKNQAGYRLAMKNIYDDDKWEINESVFYSI